MRKAFTLIELLISIMILSILMVFLYRSYADLNRSNVTLSQEIKKLERAQLVKKTLYLDFTMALKNQNYPNIVKILKQDKKEDVVFFQTANSLHKRINPYVAYIIKEKKLYRLESLKPFKEYPMGADAEFVVDELGAVKIFRVYKSRDKKPLYLIHILFENKQEIILKTSVLNS